MMTSELVWPSSEGTLCAVSGSSRRREASRIPVKAAKGTVRSSRIEGFFKPRMVAHVYWRYGCPVILIECLLAFSKIHAHRMLRLHLAPQQLHHRLSGPLRYLSHDLSTLLGATAASLNRTLGSALVAHLALALVCSQRSAAAASFRISRNILSRVFGSSLLSVLLNSGLYFDSTETRPSNPTSLQLRPCTAFAYIRARGSMSWWEAVRSCDLYAVAAHLDLGADVNSVEDGSCWSLLHWAAARGRVPLMELAIGCGAHVDARDRGGCTPLHLAARNDRVDAASLLINCGTDVDARGDAYCTPLHMAAYRGHSSVMRALIDLRANLQAQCNELRTPLHWAAHEGHCDAIRVLIGCGADLNTAAGDSGAALHLAAFKGQCHALSLLLDARAEVNSRQAVGPHSRDRQVQLLNSSAAQFSLSFSLSIRGCIFGQRLLL